VHKGRIILSTTAADGSMHEAMRVTADGRIFVDGKLIGGSVDVNRQVYRHFNKGDRVKVAKSFEGLFRQIGDTGTVVAFHPNNNPNETTVEVKWDDGSGSGKYWAEQFELVRVEDKREYYAAITEE
jgi:hypothetical protein